MSYKYFTAQEVRGLLPHFADRLDALRTLATALARRDGYVEDYGRVVINSGLREGDDGAHGLGLGADIDTPTSRSRYYLLKAAFLLGFRRLGIYDLHVHVDAAHGEGFDQDVAWHGKSQ